jgi:hypothetical protein
MSACISRAWRSLSSEWCPPGRCTCWVPSPHRSLGPALMPALAQLHPQSVPLSAQRMAGHWKVQRLQQEKRVPEPGCKLKSRWARFCQQSGRHTPHSISGPSSAVHAGMCCQMNDSVCSCFALARVRRPPPYSSGRLPERGWTDIASAAGATSASGPRQCDRCSLGQCSMVCRFGGERCVMFTDRHGWCSVLVCEEDWDDCERRCCTQAIFWHACNSLNHPQRQQLITSKDIVNASTRARSRFSNSSTCGSICILLSKQQ